MTRKQKEELDELYPIMESVVVTEEIIKLNESHLSDLKIGTTLLSVDLKTYNLPPGTIRRSRPLEY